MIGQARKTASAAPRKVFDSCGRSIVFVSVQCLQSFADVPPITFTVTVYIENRLMSSAYAASTYVPGLSNVALEVAVPRVRLFLPSESVTGTTSGLNVTRPGPRHCSHDVRSSCLRLTPPSPFP